jgi:putative hydrolase of the HAD superfamily
LSRQVWFFDLDNTRHDASHAAFGVLNTSFTEYIQEHLRLSHDDANELRQRYWRRYGATLLGLERHHGTSAAHFLEQTHRLPGLEQRVRSHGPSDAALKRLSGDKYVLTNGPGDYARRVLQALGIEARFKGVISIEDMRMFGELRPKPDKRMFRHLLARMKLRAVDCTLVEDTLDHQRAAHALGMRTVWMQRYLRTPMGPLQTSLKRVSARRRPAYVYARITSLQTLCRL